MEDNVRYRRTYCLFWRDEKIRQLDLLDKAIATYCFTGPQSNRIGLFSFSLAMANEDLGCDDQTFDERFGNVGGTLRERFLRVCETMGWRWDSRSRVLYIPTWWRWNQPENVNNLIGNMKDLAEVPKTQFTEEFRRNTTYLKSDLKQTFLQRYGNVTETVSKRPPSQEQEQEQDIDVDVDVGADGNSQANGTDKLPPKFAKRTQIDWQQAQLIAAEVHHAGLKVTNDSDRSLLFKVAVLAKYHPGFDREWIRDAVRAATRRSVKNRFGKFFTEIEMRCSDHGAKFRQLLRDVPEPPPPAEINAYADT